MNNPTWNYRRGEDGEVESQIFDGMQDGWFDSPAAIPDEDDHAEPTAASIKRMTKAQLIEHLAKHDVAADPEAKADDLRAQLLAVIGG